MKKREKILIALCGMSPAVLTETVYALAEDKCCPSQVIVITTTAGREKIEEELFQSGIWGKLLNNIKVNIDLGMTSYHIRLIPKSDALGDAEDILTTSDNTRTADFILGTLREFTENADTEIIFSIAGGRKTMSVLGSMAMALLGREQDRLCHVLVNYPFDNPSLKPRFYFPEKKKRVFRLSDGNEFSEENAEITLCDIPFPRLKYLFQSELNRLPGNFNDTVALANSRISNRIQPPDLKIIPERMEIFFNEKPVRFNCAEFVMYWMLADRARNNFPPLHGQASLREEFEYFAANIPNGTMPEIIHHREKLIVKSDDDMRKLISAISSKIRNCVSIEEGRDPAMPSISRGVYALGLTSDHIVIL